MSTTKHGNKERVGDFVYVSSGVVPDKAWFELKRDFGVYNPGDFDFFLWPEEIDESNVSSDLKKFLNREDIAEKLNTYSILYFTE